jgi:hypothetical protein
MCCREGRNGPDADKWEITWFTLYLYSGSSEKSCPHRVGHVVHGIELCRIAQGGDRYRGSS